MILKEDIFTTIKEVLNGLSIKIKSIDDQRPWGGFFVIDETDAHKFINQFFPTINIDNIASLKVSPKILLVEPNKKLSWQYHHRRSEIWKLIDGEAGLIRSETNEESALHKLIKGEIIELKKEERHRLVGLEKWGVVAEIWIHSDIYNPSDEEDIIRLQDDFGRKNGLEKN